MMQDTVPQIYAPRIYVVFTGKTDIRWLRFLKTGYRHCFALINDGHHWISVDPLSNYTDVMVHHVPVAFDFPAYLRARGYAVVLASVSRPAKPSPFAILTCVESVKRIIGLHHRFIITPWQLYRYLTPNPRKTGEQ